MMGQRGYDVYGVEKKINRHVIRALCRLQSVAEPDDAPGIFLSEITYEVLCTICNLNPVKNARSSIHRSMVNLISNGVVQEVAVGRFLLVDDDGAALLCGIPTLAEKAKRDQERREKKALLEASGAGSKRRRKWRTYFTSLYKLRKLRKRRAAAKMMSNGINQDAVTTYDDMATAAEPVAEVVQNFTGILGPVRPAPRDMHNVEQEGYQEPVPLVGPKRRRKKRAYFTSPYKLRKLKERKAAAKMRSNGINQDAVTTYDDMATAAEPVAEVVQNFTGILGPVRPAPRDMHNVEQEGYQEPVPLVGPKRRRKKRAYFTSPYKLRKLKERKAAAKMRSNGINQDAVTTYDDMATEAEPNADHQNFTGILGPVRPANPDMHNVEQEGYQEPVPLVGPKRRRKKRAYFTSPYKLRKLKERKAAAKMRSNGINQDAVTTYDDMATEAEPNADHQNFTGILGPVRPANPDMHNVEQEGYQEPVPLVGPKRRRKKRAYFTSPYKLRKQKARKAAAKKKSSIN